MSKAYRPSHADATYDFKYGVRSVQVTVLNFSVIWINRIASYNMEVSCLILPLNHFMAFMKTQGGGRSSARETIGRVAAGAVAKKILKLKSGTEVGLFKFDE